jgi:hypothetical protein
MGDDYDPDTFAVRVRLGSRRLQAYVCQSSVDEACSSFLPLHVVTLHLFRRALTDPPRFPATSVCDVVSILFSYIPRYPKICFVY